MIDMGDYEARRAMHTLLRVRQLELETLIRKNADNLDAVTALRQEYREVVQQISNILTINIFESAKQIANN